jgi:hypothetical protein
MPNMNVERGDFFLVAQSNLESRWQLRRAASFVRKHAQAKFVSVSIIKRITYGRYARLWPYMGTRPMRSGNLLFQFGLKRRVKLSLVQRTTFSQGALEHVPNSQTQKCDSRIVNSWFPIRTRQWRTHDPCRDHRPLCARPHGPQLDERIRGSGAAARRPGRQSVPSVKAYREFAAETRLEGWNAWLMVPFSPAPLKKAETRYKSNSRSSGVIQRGPLPK